MTFRLLQSAALRYWPAGLAAVVGCSLSLVAVLHLRSMNQSLAHERLERASQVWAQALAQRLVAQTGLGMGLRTLWNSGVGPSPEAFVQMLDAQSAGQTYPEIKSWSYARWEPPSGFQSLSDQPEVPPGLEGRYVTAFTWPAHVHSRETPETPAGLDLLQRVRHSGLPAVSAPQRLQLASGPCQGYVLAVPIWGQDTPYSNGSPRFQGGLMASVCADDLLRALALPGPSQSLALQLEDLGAEAPGTSSPQYLAELLATGVDEQPGRGLATPAVQVLTAQNRYWRLTVEPKAPLLSAVEQKMPWWLGLCGGLATVLLTGWLYQSRRQVAAQRGRRPGKVLYHALFDHAAIGVAQIETHTGRFVRVNPRYCSIVGYPAETLLQKTFHSVSHPDELAEDVAQLERLKAGEIAEYRLERRVIRGDGTAIWADLTVSPLWQPGEPAHMHMVVLQDITESHQLQRQLQRNETRLYRVLDSLPVGVCLVQHDGSMTYRNKRFLQICGFTQEEVPDLETWWEKAVEEPLERDSARRKWAQAGNPAGDALGMMPPTELAIRSSQGLRRVVEIAGVMLENDRLMTMVDLSQRKADEEEIKYLAFYDLLTHLPNRRLLLDRVQQALSAGARRQRSGALLMLDLDHFKTLNETRGHDCGDSLLRQVARRLNDCVHEDHTVARHGGDEFVVLLEDLADSPEEAAAAAEEMAQRILVALRSPYMLDGEPYHGTVSMGATLFEGLADSADELLKRADMAMYQAKAAGRNMLQFYDPRVQAVLRARAALELDLRAGLAEGQFELFYQPQMEDGRITGAEALLRWRHPRDGYISPAAFIPLAEEAGLILPLGEWVLQTACHQLAAWARNPALAHLRLAVNVSPRQFHLSSFVPQVLAALAVSGAQARQLELELTEGLLLEDVEDTIEKMAQLKGYGVGFSLDDFGTGYSSLSYLKRLPLDQLKIDQSFVRDVLSDPNDAAIARTIVALGTSLGLRVIAEGVETEAQRAFLESNHCRAWQGYLLSPPVPLDQFEALVLDHAHA
jgi:diguanylate cyclase (GGDEF)-like protein/PAS domain S-box-containing protein